MPLPLRLIAIDIDGTLLNREFNIPQENLQVLRRAHDLGIEIVLVTGRRHRFAMPIAEMLGFPIWLISSNGAVTKSMEGELFHHDYMPAQTARLLIKAMDEFRDNAVLTFDREDQGAIVIEELAKMSPRISGWIQKNLEFISCVKPMENALTCDPVQVMFCGDVKRMNLAGHVLKTSGMDEKITILKTEYVARDLCLYDILNAGCSKGHALERWSKHRGYSRDQVMAIGDNHNDVEMLEYAGVPVIMGNAADDLKRPGWTVTSSNDDSGVAAAVKRYLDL